MKKSIKSFKKLIRELDYILLPEHKKKIFPIFLMIFISSILELLGVTAILPFVYALLEPEKIMSNKYVSPVLEFFGAKDTMSVLTVLGVGIILLYLVKNIVLLISTYIQTNFATGVQRDLSIKMLNSYLSRPYTFFLDAVLGEISRGVDGDVASVYSSIQTLLQLLMAIITSLLIAVYMFIADPIIAGGTLCVGLIVVLLLTTFFKPTMSRLGKKQMESSRKRNQALNQTVHGIKELMVMGREDLFADQYVEASTELRVNRRNSTVISAVPNRVVEAFFVAGFMIIVLLRLEYGGSPSTFVPTLASFALGAFKIMPYISSFSNKINQLVYNQPAIDNVYRNMIEADKYQQEVEEYNRKIAIQGENIPDDCTLHFEKILEARNVLWQYPKAVVPVLSDASIRLEKGESIAFIGSSGAGKTTLSDVILGLLRPQQGGIYMDGADVYTIPKTWSKIIGYVPQSVFLLAGNIRDNVSFGLKDVDDKDIWEALDKAQLGEFIRNLPEGLNTQVGERGVKLSGGQRQRIAIARALFNKPEILVLDEATSALDNETETAIMESIDALAGQITMIIVAHRLTTIRNCNRIYRIGDGVAKEVSHEEIFGNE